MPAVPYCEKISWGLQLWWPDIEMLMSGTACFWDINQHSNIRIQRFFGIFICLFGFLGGGGGGYTEITLSVCL